MFFNGIGFVQRLVSSGRLMVWALSVAWCSGCAAPAASLAAPSYEVRYNAKLLPAEGSALVSIQIRQPASIFRSADFAFDPERFQLVEADGFTELANGRLLWRPPAGGGELALKVKIDHQRRNKGYDARMTESWALLRADDLFPAARSVATPGAQSRASLRVQAPEGWSVVTAYGREPGEWVAVNNPARRFDRPTGWIAAGKLGVRVDSIAGTEVVVAAPRGQLMRRIDILALLHWTLPEIVAVFGPLPSLLTIVGAGDPMWRGGLSAPTSIYLHSSRPLISENGTSTLLHEIMHVALGGGRGDDWLVEGLAEYYALEALARSGSISEERYRSAQDKLKTWGQRANKLPLDRSSGAQTALAVTLLQELNTQIQLGSNKQRNLDDVVKQLEGTELNLAALMQAARRATNRPLADLERRIQNLID